VNHRWLGGHTDQLGDSTEVDQAPEAVEAMTEDGRMLQLSKKERARLDREMKHLFQNLEGIENRRSCRMRCSSSTRTPKKSP